MKYYDLNGFIWWVCDIEYYLKGGWENDFIKLDDLVKENMKKMQEEKRGLQASKLKENFNLHT